MSVEQHKEGRKPRIAVVGAGLIGKKHIGLVSEAVELAAVIDPTPAAESIAESHGAAWFADLHDYLGRERPDGVIVATPNQLHVEHGLACIEAGIPILIEKPIADEADGAEKLVSASEAAGVPILVGHHRRHNPLIEAARQAIESGRLGDIVSVNAQFWLYKPDDYFDVDWRKREGAGPVFINLIHDVDLLRHLCGEVVSVQAIDSRRARGHEVEDSAVVLLEFDNGALGTVTVSDTIVAPWSWEFASGENPAYPHTETSCYRIGGNKASLSIPDLTLWFHPGQRSWWEPIERTTLPYEAQDPLPLQLKHFVDVIRNGAKPLVSGREGLQTLRVVEAIKRAAATRTLQRL
jgi:predicted dehydrogenase